MQPVQIIDGVLGGLLHIATSFDDILPFGVIRLHLLSYLFEIRHLDDELCLRHCTSLATLASLNPKP